MFDEKKLRFPYFAVIAGVIFFLFHYTGLISFKIGNASPFLFVPLVVAVAMYYGELTGLFYGLFAGLLIDTSASSSFCFNTVFLMLAGFIVGILAEFLFNVNFKASLALSIIVSFFYFGAKWIVFYFIPDVQGKIYFLLQYSLPSAFYTCAFIVPFFFAEKYFADKYKRKNNINNI